ncbi:MAG: hypothetical protein F4Y78_00435 [Candidatus Dadabacteria bacterium]|nr:hypothetical protein [Candidatus Dadabacteria bacterium]MYA47819.1 hypothetical protein [Candidatus Dadabacteria bacterium]MYF48132.1 hypothetical protein [Candidatus Dadabacteria bacterium]MYG82554.1 hypothetical protein [Candidatus Dadabacteria bacterium]MYK49877.1 hypothetical protein [Candidatus Dadabacteria bacterium]
MKFILLIGFIILIAGCGGDGGDGTKVPPPPEPTPEPTPEPGGNDYSCSSQTDDPVSVLLDNLEPYSCNQQGTSDSPWVQAGLVDLGGSDSLSLIRDFKGCAPDSTYRGELDIYVDISRIPVNASGWPEDDGTRVNLSMEDAVALLNQHVAAYYRRISQGNLRITFHSGNEFRVGGNGSWAAALNQQLAELGICEGLADCDSYLRQHGHPSGLNRILLNDVGNDTGGIALDSGQWVSLGLASFRLAYMETIVHEIGHAWLGWPHSYTELPFRVTRSAKLDPPNPYSNPYDIMSRLYTPFGWDSNMPSTHAINRYTAGWISPADVALHLEDEATYTLSKPRESGYQFLVIHSGRPYAFTTIELLEGRASKYKDDYVTDPSVPGERRCRRYEGVLVSRYDQSSGTGGNARLGPALYDKSNPDFLTDVGIGNDDYSVIPDGGTRDIGSGVSVSARRNPDGSYEVTVSGGKIAEFKKWCSPAEWIPSEGRWRYDAGCLLNELLGLEPL